MKKTFKKIASSVMAAATLAVGMTGMTASAYAPTISKNFGVGSYSATASLYRDSSQAVAKVTLSGASSLSVSVSVTGTVSETTTSGSVASGYKRIAKTGRNITSARGSYSASKGGSKGSTSINA